MIKIVFIVLVYFTCVFSCSARQVTRIKSYIYNEKRRIPVEIINEKLNDKTDLTILGFTLEESTISSVMENLGNAKKLHTGDAANSNLSICYVNPLGVGVRFSSGEMDGGKYISKIDVFSSPVKFDSCSGVPISKIPNSIGNRKGIILGIDKKTVLGILGIPSVKYSNDNWEYLYQSKEDNSKCKEGYDITESYNLKFKKGKLIHFFIIKTTSCWQDSLKISKKEYLQ